MNDEGRWIMWGREPQSEMGLAIILVVAVPIIALIAAAWNAH